MNLTKGFTSFFGIIVLFGGLLLVLRGNGPQQAAALLSAGASTIEDTTKALEGRGT